jgi:hypothetical protein
MLCVQAQIITIFPNVIMSLSLGRTLEATRDDALPTDLVPVGCLQVLNLAINRLLDLTLRVRRAEKL